MLYSAPTKEERRAIEQMKLDPDVRETSKEYAEARLYAKHGSRYGIAVCSRAATEIHLETT